MRNTFLYFLVLLSNTAFPAAFQNLDFESAIVNPTQSGQSGTYEPISNALPGWHAYLGEQEVTTILHNNYNLGSPTIYLFGPSFSSSYYVDLYPGPGGASISQTGQVPDDSQYLIFKSKLLAVPSSDPNTHISISVNNNQLGIMEIFNNTEYSVFRADISAYKGQEVNLKFTSLFISGYPNWVSLDDIQFSNVPEPGILSLLGLGLFSGACLFWRSWRWR
jgi:hypothetical protein